MFLLPRGDDEFEFIAIALHFGDGRAFVEEGAGTKNVSGRGGRATIISDLNQPWGDSETCTACGKCVMSCPTGALFYKGSTVSEMERDRGKLEFIVNAREKKQWNV